jgi:organic hydroperoxide reductase OsmC/OhrA
MQDLPHHYRVSTKGEPEGSLSVTADSVGMLPAAPPPEFGGPEDHWSPETLLVAAVSSCFVLSFRAIAKASRLPWDSLECHAEGKLERVERAMKFTRFTVHTTLQVPHGTDEQKAHRILEKAEATCLVTNSMTASRHLNAVVKVAEPS